MAFARPFAFNTGTTIPGTIQIGNLAVGVDNIDYSEQPGGVQWWNGPDEELGYVIAHETLSGTQPNPLSIPAYLGFWRSEELTTPSFVTLSQWVSSKDNDPQTFTGGTEAKTWLNNNGYWTSYSEYIKSTEKTNTGGFPVGYFIDKDMTDGDTLSYPSESLPGGVSQNITSSYWDDWGDDIFDDWGYFYLYDPAQNNYLGLEFLSIDINLPNGEFRTTTFDFNGRTFNILQGYPVEGIFKFEITVNDNLPFIFGEGGNMGSDGSTVNGDLTYNYGYDGNNMTLWYNENYQSGNEQERFYTYYVPYNINQNTTQTYTKTLNDDDLYFYSNEVNNGLTVYHSKGVDVKEWVVYDLGGSEVVPTTTTTTTEAPTTTTTTEAPTTTTTTTTSGGTGEWNFYYTTEGDLNVGPPENNGNMIFLQEGNPSQQTFNPNYIDGTLSLFFNVNDSVGNSYLLQFQQLDISGGTLTITQNGNTAIYTGEGLDFYYESGFNFAELRVENSSLVVQVSPQPFVYGQPVTVTLSPN
jgi:hypothetical protein